MSGFEPGKIQLQFSIMEPSRFRYGSYICSYLIAVILAVSVIPNSLSSTMGEEEAKAKAALDTPPPSDLDTVLHIDNIIPDLLDRAPNYTVAMTWIGGAEAKLGNKLSPKAIAEIPHLVAWHGNGSLTPEERDDYFTLLLTGPDHPSRETPNQREFLYWHQGNIQGYVQEKRDTIVEYLGPNPANGTGKHRIVAFVYKQPSQLKFEEPVINETDYEDSWRLHWNTRRFAKKYKLGEPYAVNYFFVEFES